MSVRSFIDEVRGALHSTFTEVDVWFEKSPEVRSFRPTNGGWTINEILEHIGLTSHYLLIIIDKGVQKAIKRSTSVDLDEISKGYEPHRGGLSEIGTHRSFPWIRPEHMEPSGARALSEIRAQLWDQQRRCIEHLDTLPNGEGVLVRTTMTVNDLGKLDVYEYIFFLAQHAHRHIEQMHRNETEYHAQ